LPETICSMPRCACISAVWIGRRGSSGAFETVDEYQYCGKGRLAAEYLYLFDDGKWSVYGLYRVSEWCDLNVVLGTIGIKEN